MSLGNVKYFIEQTRLVSKKFPAVRQEGGEYSSRYISQLRMFETNQSWLRIILPLIVFGSFSRNSTMRGYLYGAVCSFT